MTSAQRPVRRQHALRTDVSHGSGMAPHISLAALRRPWQPSESAMPEAEVQARIAAARERLARGERPAFRFSDRDPEFRTGPVVLALMRAGMTPEGALETALDGLGDAMLHALGRQSHGGPR